MLRLNAPPQLLASQHRLHPLLTFLRQWGLLWSLPGRAFALPWRQFLLLAWLAGGPAPTMANICPTEMDVKLPKPAEAPPGWDKLLLQSKQPLLKIQLFDGPPDAAPEIRPKVRQPKHTRWEFRTASKQGQIPAKPEASPLTATASEDDRNEANSIINRLAGGNSAPAVRPLWIKCSYGSGPITLLRPLPADFSACTLKCEQGCQLWCH